MEQTAGVEIESADVAVVINACAFSSDRARNRETKEATAFLKKRDSRTRSCCRSDDVSKIVYATEHCAVRAGKIDGGNSASSLEEAMRRSVGNILVLAHNLSAIVDAVAVSRKSPHIDRCINAARQKKADAFAARAINTHDIP
jgi:hypothetical protein